MYIGWGLGRGRDTARLRGVDSRVLSLDMEMPIGNTAIKINPATNVTEDIKQMKNHNEYIRQSNLPEGENFERICKTTATNANGYSH